MMTFLNPLDAPISKKSHFHFFCRTVVRVTSGARGSVSISGGLSIEPFGGGRGGGQPEGLYRPPAPELKARPPWDRLCDSAPPTPATPRGGAEFSVAPKTIFCPN